MGRLRRRPPRFNHVWSALRIKPPQLPRVDVPNLAPKKRKADFSPAKTSKKTSSKPKNLSPYSSSFEDSREGTPSGRLATDPEASTPGLDAPVPNPVTGGDDAINAMDGEVSSRLPKGADAEEEATGVPMTPWIVTPSGEVVEGAPANSCGSPKEDSLAFGGWPIP
ncbi:hypothetical protein GUJ93_ZPchr0002g24504 [Zizania palustris]|uniref:Uncharacterized protein n=1 Tax=Zizania palustris TaxID=103762 RepID=A0A8J5S6P0_ZIZPA|nr:hypothetical protein GUJ93_ZPchr0002g24504 [Zizania palustris]